jgi:cyclase
MTAVDITTELVEVADRVYAHIQPDGGWCLNNSGLLASDEGVVVIDTAATEERARRLIDRIATLHAGTGRTVVNTHHHGDHTFGNHIVTETGPVIAHENARPEMADNGLALTQLWPDVPWGDVRVTLPTIEFSDRLTVRWGGRAAELIYVGPAHTTNDIVVWLPEERVLFAGDVALSGCTPFVLMGSVAGSLDAIAQLRHLGATTIIGGHGPVSGPELLAETESYLRWLTELAQTGIDAQLTPLELARAADRERFGELRDPERLVANLHRAYAELNPDLRGVARAAPLDVVSIFGEMVEYNAGTLPTCLA